MPSQVEAEVDVLRQRLEESERRVAEILSAIEKMSNRVASLEHDSVETKIYVKQIFQMLNEIKASVHTIDQREQSTRDRSQGYWLDFFKGVMVIFISSAVTGLVTYLVYKFTGNVKP